LERRRVRVLGATIIFVQAVNHFLSGEDQDLKHFVFRFKLGNTVATRMESDWAAGSSGE